MNLKISLYNPKRIKPTYQTGVKPFLILLRVKIFLVETDVITSSLLPSVLTVVGSEKLTDVRPFVRRFTKYV